MRFKDKSKYVKWYKGILPNNERSLNLLSSNIRVIILLEELINGYKSFNKISPHLLEDKSNLVKFWFFSSLKIFLLQLYLLAK